MLCKLITVINIMITSYFKPKRERDNNANSTDDSNEVRNENTNIETKKHKTSHFKNEKSNETSRLLSNLKGSTNHSPTSVSWKTALDKHFSSLSFGRLAAFVERERYVVYHVAC